MIRFANLQGFLNLSEIISAVTKKTLAFFSNFFVIFLDWRFCGMVWVLFWEFLQGNGYNFAFLLLTKAVKPCII